MKKQTRGELVTAATIDVRVFFFHFFGGKCSNMKKKKNGKKCAPNCFFQKRFSERGHSRNGKWKSKHVASLSQPPPTMCACFFSISSVGNARKWKKKINGKKGAPDEYFSKWFSERGHSRKGKWKSKHVASLLQPPPLMCACSFFHFFGGKCSKMKKNNKRKKRRTKRILFEMIFRTRPLS